MKDKWCSSFVKILMAQWTWIIISSNWITFSCNYHIFVQFFEHQLCLLSYFPQSHGFFKSMGRLKQDLKMRKCTTPWRVNAYLCFWRNYKQNLKNLEFIEVVSKYYLFWYFRILLKIKKSWFTSSLNISTNRKHT